MPNFEPVCFDQASSLTFPMGTGDPGRLDGSCRAGDCRHHSRFASLLPLVSPGEPILSNTMAGLAEVKVDRCGVRSLCSFISFIIILVRSREGEGDDLAYSTEEEGMLRRSHPRTFVHHPSGPGSAGILVTGRPYPVF